jgi:Flp pilus assembly protein TadB
MTTAVGSIAVGFLVFVAMLTHVEPRLSGRWVRHRLQPAHVSLPAHTEASPDPAELAAFLDTVTRTMQSGSSLGHALVHAADMHPDLRSFTEPIALRCMQGHDVASAIGDVDPSAWSPIERHTARTLALASHNNSPDVTRHGAALIRERIAHDDERATRSAQAMASLRILTRSPLIVAALIVAMSSEARRFLFTTSAGMSCIALGAAFHVVGRRWMNRLIGQTAS